MADWYLIRKGGDYTAIGEKHHIHPVLARILKNRGVESDEEIEAFLHGGMECLHPAEEMKDMKQYFQNPTKEIIPQIPPLWIG